MHVEHATPRLVTCLLDSLSLFVFFVLLLHDDPRGVVTKIYKLMLLYVIYISFFFCLRRLIHYYHHYRRLLTGSLDVVADNNNMQMGLLSTLRLDHIHMHPLLSSPVLWVFLLCILILM